MEPNWNEKERITATGKTFDHADAEISIYVAGRFVITDMRLKFYNHEGAHYNRDFGLEFDPILTVENVGTLGREEEARLFIGKSNKWFATCQKMVENHESTSSSSN